jgi:hypothetical protein
MAALAALLFALALTLAGPASVSAASERPADARPVVLQPDAKLFILAAGQRLTGPWLAWWLSHPEHRVIQARADSGDLLRAGGGHRASFHEVTWLGW